MNYEISITINKPLEEVVTILRSRDHALKWMKGLKSFKLIEGELEAIDSRYEMVFEGKKKDSIMFETIKEFDPPHKITTVYEQGPVWNECVNLFRGHDDHCHYKMVTSFKFPWYISMFVWVFKGFFKKTTEQGMIDFKEYVESL
jgi:uncharacterized membrane protein